MKHVSLFLRAGLVALLALVFVLGAAQPVQAAEFDNDGRIDAAEAIEDDVFLSGENVVVDGTVNGMLFATGNTVTINGVIVGDVLAMGSKVILSETAQIDGNLFVGAQTVEVNGQVSGSVFVGGASATAAATGMVGRNLYFGGYSLETEPGMVVSKDLFIGGYQAQLKGEVVRNLRAAAGAVELGGKIGGDAKIDVDVPNSSVPFTPMMMQPGMPATIKSGLRIAPEAEIGGKLVYTSPADQASAIQSAPAGGVVFQTPVPKETTESKSSTKRIESVSPLLKWLFKLLRNMATLLILGALALWLLPKIYRKVVDMAGSKTLPSTGWGFVTLVVGYALVGLVALVIIMLGVLFSLVTLGGLSSTVFGVGFSGLAVFTTILTLLVSYGSKLVVAFLIGEWIARKLLPDVGGQRWWALVIGVVLYALLRSIPFVGWIFGLAATLIGLGAMWLVYRQRNTPAPVAAQ